MTWPLLAGLLPMVPLLILAASALVPTQRQVIALAPDEPVLSAPFELRGGYLGFPRISLQAELPPETAMELDADLLDLAGTVVLQFSQEGWRQTVTWVEEGATFTGDESEAAMTVALRPRTGGPHRLRLTLADLLDSAGLPRTEPITLRLEVRNHTVDAPLLLFTAMVSLAMVLILQASVYRGWQLQRMRRVEEARLGLRLRVGGSGLLRLELRAWWERPINDRPPLADLPAVQLTLTVSDALGRCRLSEQRSLAPFHGSSEDGDHWLTLVETFYLQVGEPQGLRFRFDLPERIEDGGEPWEIEWCELVLEDGVLPAFPVAAPPLARVGTLAGPGEEQPR